MASTNFTFNEEYKPQHVPNAVTVLYQPSHIPVKQITNQQLPATLPQNVTNSYGTVSLLKGS